MTSSLECCHICGAELKRCYSVLMPDGRFKQACQKCYHRDKREKQEQGK